MRKRSVFILSIIILAVVAAAIIGGYSLLFGGDNGPASGDSPHFAVKSVSSPVYFSGEDVVIEAVVMNDEPEREVAFPTTTVVTVTADPKNSSSFAYATAVPTTVAKKLVIAGTNEVIAELRGGDIGLTRKINLSLANGESKTLTFNFGQVPAGTYVATVTARSYNNSTMGKSISVYRMPTLDDWTVTGDAAFMLVNLQHDGVDVNIRNDGQHAVIFGSSQYVIYANASDSYGVPLQGLNQTVVQPGQTVTVHATIPAAGSYYLDHFAIKVPDRVALVEIGVKAWMNAAA